MRLLSFGGWRSRAWAIAGGITVLAAAIALLVALTSPFARATLTSLRAVPPGRPSTRRADLCVGLSQTA